MSKALVLGGGGVLGVSWEVGILLGLENEGIDVTGADLMVGTSAGSVVAMQLAQGKELAALAEGENSRSEGLSRSMEFDPATVMTVFREWAACSEMTDEACAQIGRLALDAKTISEDRWVTSFSDRIDGAWPDRSILLTAVDAESGEFQAWNRDSGVDAVRAVASSCTIPGMVPCVEVNGRRYMDGGVRSGTCAWLAAGYDNILVLAPLGSGQTGIDRLLGRLAREEVEALRDRGATAALHFPDDSAMEVMGPNRMDPTKRVPTLGHGIRQGQEIGESLKPHWSTVKL